MLDIWSLVHFGVGMGWWYVTRTSMVAAAMAAAIFEVVENMDCGVDFYRAKGFRLYHGDMPSNALTDVLAFLVGTMVIQRAVRSGRVDDNNLMLKAAFVALAYVSTIGTPKLQWE